MSHELGDMEKSGHRMSVDDIPAVYDSQGITEAKRGTADDQADMFRMGKKPELKVHSALEKTFRNQLLMLDFREISVSSLSLVL